MGIARTVQTYLANRGVSYDALTHEPTLHALATEAEVAQVFADCEPGAVSPMTGACGLSGVVDDSLEGFDHIYFEAGDRRRLLHVTGQGFHRLTVDLPHVPISVPAH
ncbi:prolyl-tRNA synthetase [Hyphomicrobium nitrativorans NL23]|uniref:Prolyl-tRNA synthetase n=1 Tax=Hyphomicrobium nitrativorans NL23 TaxID=1029756 RepID=V5SER8_9HYPH|nr:YbaK/EbsC family protein [Hyphomicrobium nitrativorans]AHB49356.1 prolyl-tRNA synthetase [Hyphomicrobium nitrativorans NL23]